MSIKQIVLAVLFKDSPQPVRSTGKTAREVIDFDQVIAILKGLGRLLAQQLLNLLVGEDFCGVRVSGNTGCRNLVVGIIYSGACHAIVIDNRDDHDGKQAVQSKFTNR